jgi:hypothetical protein
MAGNVARPEARTPVIKYLIGVGGIVVLAANPAFAILYRRTGTAAAPLVRKQRTDGQTERAPETGTLSCAVFTSSGGVASLHERDHNQFTIGRRRRLILLHRVLASAEIRARRG